MLKKRNIIIGIVVVAVIFGGLYFKKSQSTTDTVPTETVKRGDVSETVSVTGDVVPATYADLSFSSSGVIDDILVQKGDVIQAGTKIASLDRMVLFSKLQEARLTLAIAEENEKLALRNRKLNSPEDRSVKKLTTEQARKALNTITEQMKENVIYSPIEGRISKFDARVGEVISAGKIVARVVKEGEYQIEARVPESDIAKVALGMKANITFDSLSKSEIFDAYVMAIDPAATVVQDVVSYVVTFRLAEFDGRLKEGMTANIDIETAKRNDILWVPFRTLAKEGGKTYAQLKKEDGTFEKVDVVTGLEGDEGTIEVKSGLQEGDVVAIGAVQKK